MCPDRGEGDPKREGVRIAHFGAFGGGDRVDGEPGTRTLALKLPCFLSLD